MNFCASKSVPRPLLTIDKVNLLNCFSLLDGNTISIPVTIDLLSGDTIPLSA